MTDEQIYREMVNNIIDGLYCIDIEGRVTFMNKTLREGLGIREDQYFNRHFLDFMDSSYHKYARENFNRIMRGEDGIPYELKHTDRNGQSQVVEIHSMPILENGRVTGIWGIARDITKSRLAADALENLLSDRNAEISDIHRQLSMEIMEREQTEIALHQKEAELLLKADEIMQMNAALKDLLKARDHEKIDLADIVLSNIRDFVLPYIDKLKHQENGNASAKHYLELIESNLGKVVSPFAQNLKFKYRNLTPKEIQIVDFICEGKGTKEIAELLNLSVKTVEFHRDGIRNKFGIKKQKINLRTFLLSL